LRRTVHPCRGIFALVALVLCRPLAAEEAVPPAEIDATGRAIANAPLGAGRAGVAQWSGAIDFFTPVAGSSQCGLGLDVIAERRTYHFRDFGDFLPGRSAPLSQAALITLQPTLAVNLTPSWSVVGSTQLQSAAAPGAPLRDALLSTGSVGAFFSKKNLKIGLSLEFEQRLSGSPLIVPYPIIDWNFSGRWHLTALDGQSGRLSCDVTGEVSVFGQLEFQSQDIRLGRRSSIPSGILRYEAFPLFGGLQYKPGPHLVASLAAGAALAQNHRFEDERGHLLRTSDRHSPFICVLELDYSF